MFEISETTVPRAFRNRPVEVAAARWFKNGDHPRDEPAIVERLGDAPDVLTEGKVVRYFRNPGVSGSKVCRVCAQAMDGHGWIDQGTDGITVCPGDWVLTLPDGTHDARNPTDFAALYEPHYDVPASARQPGQRPGAERLEGTKHLAEYWVDAAKGEKDKVQALICLHQAVNAWKNAAYALAEELARQHAAKVPIPREAPHG